MEKDRSLERRFQSVKVTGPSEDEAIRILQGVRERYEKFHAVTYNEEAIRYAVYLSNRYIPDRYLPDKAIDLIDEAGARVKLRQATLTFPSAHAYSQLGMVFGKMRDNEKALDALAKAEMFDPRFVMTYVYRGKIHLKTNQPAAAIVDYNRALALNPTLNEARQELALAERTLRAGH